MPKAFRVAVLSNPTNAYTARLVKETEAAARSLAVRLQLLAVREAGALDRAFSEIRRERPDAPLTQVGYRTMIAR
ncbi:MAG TPA: hypothetical protein VLF65_17235 [Burkholderiales bacterium]|nr:hypothetical protein [Burkholderiales bacterium]